VADRVVQGQSAEPLLDQVAGGANRGDRPATETAAARPAVQRAPPPGPSGGESPAQDKAVYDHAGRLRQLTDTRDPSNPNNTLTAREMYETWRNLWSSRGAQAKHRLQQVKDRMRGEDPLGYAEKKERFDSGLRDALGPQYEAAENETALCSAELSSMEEVLSWLEDQETMGRHVTLEQASHHALEWAHARDKYGSVVMTIFLMGLPFAMAGGGSVPPEIAPATDGAAAEGAAADGVFAEEAGAAETGTTAEQNNAKVIGGDTVASSAPSGATREAAAKGTSAADATATPERTAEGTAPEERAAGGPASTKDASQDASANATREVRKLELGQDPATGQYRAAEGETAVRVEDATGVKLSRSPDPRVDWIDIKTGKTYDAVGNFPSKHFETQWPNLKSKIMDHLAKADFVPIDVSQFTLEQIAKVAQFIADEGLAPRAFLVGH